jgi:hypothetical protein
MAVMTKSVCHVLGAEFMMLMFSKLDMSRISHVLISLGKLTTNHHLDLEIPPS